MPFIDNGMIKVFTVPVKVDLMRARKAIQTMLDLNNNIRYNFDLDTLNG
jgi:hypothetical protein